jgi:hypothetical protein
MDYSGVGERKPQYLAVAAVSALLLGVMLLFTVTSSAKAGERNFCYGVTLPPKNQNGQCNTAGSWGEYWYAYIDAVYGSGDQHSVCVGLTPKGAGTSMCSTGPSQGVYNNTMNGALGFPFVENNATGSSTKAYGKAWFHTPPPAEEESPPPPPPPPPSPTWHAAQSLGGSVNSDVDVSSWGPGRLDVFARGTDNALKHRWFDGGTWSAWENMGGNLASAPSAVSWGPNRIDVVARATDNTILHWYWDGVSWKSDNWGGNIVSNPDISSWGPGRLDVFGRGPDNALWHRAYSSAYGLYPWESLGGTIAGGPGAVSWSPGRIDVAARTPSNTIAHWYWTEGWHSDTIPGTIISDPDLSSRGEGRLDLFAQGSGGGLQHLWWENGVGWSSIWEGLSGSLASGPGAVSWEPNTRIDVVGRASDNTVTHWWWSP